MSDIGLVQERQALLGLELSALGADTRRLGFIRWLVAHDQDPEWYGRRPPRKPRRRVRTASQLLAA